MKHYITALKAMAALLITNSHFGHIYPISALATGGALGNSLFFFLSGLCLSKCDLFYGKWILEKIKRLYVPLVIVQLVCFIVGYYKLQSVQQIFRLCVYPTNYWFVPAFLIAMAIAYIYDKLSVQKRKIALICLIGLGILLYYVRNISMVGVENDFVVKTIFYSVMTVIGYEMKSHKEAEESKLCSGCIMAGIGIVGLYGWKILESRIMLMHEVQWVEYIFLIIFILGAFRTGKALESKFVKFSNSKLWKMGVEFVAAHTLEIYFVQVPLLSAIAWMTFPISFIVAVVGICVLASMLKQINNLLLRKAHSK